MCTKGLGWLAGLFIHPATLCLYWNTGKPIFSVGISVPFLFRRMKVEDNILYLLLMLKLKVWDKCGMRLWACESRKLVVYFLV